MVVFCYDLKTLGELHHFGSEWRQLSSKACFCVDGFSQGVFSSRNENFWISHRMFRGCRKRFSDTNKKANYIVRLETAR